MIRLKAVRRTTGDRILPAFTATTTSLSDARREPHHHYRFRQRDTRGEPARMVVEGFNLSK